MVDTSAGVQRKGGFLGHPWGLGVLCFSEAWERFAFYGMQALLVLYMTQQLLLPGHIEHVAGFADFRTLIDPGHSLSPTALASAVFGLYAGGVYLTPIFGGFLADWVLGRTWTITIGALVMAAGYFLLSFEQPFLPAIALILIGVGCFKGNIASQVGELYAPDDLRRADAFQLYLLGINIAVIIAPLICGYLGQRVAWRYGFMAAGVGMVVGLAVYLAGQSLLPASSRKAREAAAIEPRAPITGREWVTIVVLVALLPVLALASLGNQQIFNSYLVWGDAHYDLHFGGQTLPVTWLVSLDAFISTGMIIAVLAFWRWWGSKWREPDEIIKMAIGAAVAAGAPLLLAFASLSEVATGHKASLVWGLGFHVINDIGFSMLFPVGLALFSRAAPRAVAGAMLGVYYLHLFLCNLAVGYLGGLLEKMGPAPFWFLHAGLVTAGAVLMVLFAIFFRRYIAPTSEAELA
jgi:POT family proton-dependent oligopeptide transporter